MRTAETSNLNGSPTVRPWLLLVLLWWSGAFVGLPVQAAENFVRLMNLGKAQLENRTPDKAIESFTVALSLEPDSVPALRNLTRARMLAGEDAEALKLLQRAETLQKDSAATSYLAGLASLHRSQFDKSVRFLQAAVRLDAFTPALRFQLANACQKAGQHEQAIVQLRETVRLDPLHASAHFKLAAYASQAGDQAEFERRQQEFARLRKIFGDEFRTPAGLERCVHTQPEAAPVPPPAFTAGNKSPVPRRYERSLRRRRGARRDRRRCA
jgi:tetratricopeptide (TPR) repeat protein